MEELKNIKVALLGSGTVGTGVYKLIERQREELPHKVGAGLTVSKVLVRDKNKKREGIDPSVLTDQWEDIITDDDIQIVVEVMGGIEPARTYITEALQAGKNVVTANKDLMAVHGGSVSGDWTDAPKGGRYPYLFQGVPGSFRQTGGGSGGSVCKRAVRGPGRCGGH